ncbi:aminoacyl-tRNA hydrolase [Mycoplasma tauri]|uniref:Peptidyl-tRNA hydrolase n=1 Tax=Mycoplasma tauri TaxID=547987 RepID=A0A953NE99_9MOLU|nr:aminoacyl-tRNA hydrolase [Mycoplasma tauri]MBZ4195333.1 aminoacyl-tRNA hydrolase [Mycoplasma tauri]MBZ4203462.1 aminoacyl-tRNA hydrolase [Mycoplasma tauri]MBZ4204014.1 aminoacyl-tRNA hydrolase [Mycoplasma tauri]MBZ4212769.1 aminoacyl-tRNA hydrolase [Mycoplasma tauri]MBZ4218333.1 aminoacyl-tRNA hydrolase [Mycoplasma tauri]
MKLIVGLGNPGNEYKFTKHNAGFLAIDKIIDKLNLGPMKERFNGEFIVSDGFILAKPLTYMNNSGEFIHALANFYKINSSDIIVIYDDKDFSIGQAALKIGGSSAGHNGIKSITNKFKDNDYKRIRVGIGFNNKMPLKEYVLSKFNKEEIIILDEVLDRIADVALSLVYNDFVYVMNKFNTENKKREI